MTASELEQARQRLTALRLARSDRQWSNERAVATATATDRDYQRAAAQAGQRGDVAPTQPLPAAAPDLADLAELDTQIEELQAMINEETYTTEVAEFEQLQSDAAALYAALKQAQIDLADALTDLNVNQKRGEALYNRIAEYAHANGGGSLGTWRVTRWPVFTDESSAKIAAVWLAGWGV